MKQWNFKIKKLYSANHLCNTKLICWSTGPTDPILSKHKKIILKAFGQMTFFIYYFPHFEKRSK